METSPLLSWLVLNPLFFWTLPLQAVMPDTPRTAACLPQTYLPIPYIPQACLEALVSSYAPLSVCLTHSLFHLHPIDIEASIYDVSMSNRMTNKRRAYRRLYHLLFAKQPAYTVLVIRPHTNTFFYYRGYVLYRKDMGVFYDLRKVPVEIRAALLPQPLHINSTVIVKYSYKSPDHIRADSIPLLHILSVYLLMLRMQGPHTFIKQSHLMLGYHHPLIIINTQKSTKYRLYPDRTERKTHWYRVETAIPRYVAVIADSGNWSII